MSRNFGVDWLHAAMCRGHNVTEITLNVILVMEVK